MKLFGKQFTFNNNKVYHSGDKPVAADIVFTDGKTFQQKLDDGSLKGVKGDTGATGAKGDKGDTGATGAAGLTTSVTVDGTKYNHSNGNITLPNYPTLSSLGAAASSHGTHISDSGWKKFTLSSGLTIPDDGVARYRKINNIVYVQINLLGLTHAGGGATAVAKTVATLPSGYRPSAYLPIDGTAGASQSNPCRFESNTDGTIKFRSATSKVTTEHTVHLSYSFMI